MEDPKHIYDIETFPVMATKTGSPVVWRFMYDDALSGILAAPKNLTSDYIRKEPFNDERNVQLLSPASKDSEPKANSSTPLILSLRLDSTDDPDSTQPWPRLDAWPDQNPTLILP